MARTHLGIALAALAALAASSIAMAQNVDTKLQAHTEEVRTESGASADPVSTAKVDPMKAYYGNTYSCYWTGTFQCRHWWNPDGTEIYFETRWLPEGMITTKTVEGRYQVFYANGQWCAVNARSAIPGARGGVADPNAPKPKIDAYDNDQLDCAPIIDATPGDRWVKLHAGGTLQGDREQYVLLPGHQ